MQALEHILSRLETKIRSGEAYLPLTGTLHSFCNLEHAAQNFFVKTIPNDSSPLSPDQEKLIGQWATYYTRLISNPFL